MERINPYVKRHKLALLLASGIIVLVGATVIINSLYDKQLQQYSDKAMAVGVLRAKHECREEDVPEADCNAMEAVISIAECMGEQCWIVNAQTKDPTVYASGVTVVERHGKFQVIDYTRTTFKRIAD